MNCIILLHICFYSNIPFMTAKLCVTHLECWIISELKNFLVCSFLPVFLPYFLPHQMFLVVIFFFFPFHSGDRQRLRADPDKGGVDAARRRQACVPEQCWGSRGVDQQRSLNCFLNVLIVASLYLAHKYQSSTFHEWVTKHLWERATFHVETRWTRVQMFI